jgi:hypothetical protein
VRAALLVLLVACGDNIMAPPPDAAPELELDWGGSGWVLDPTTAPDAGAPLPLCVDRHQPKQDHKCQHEVKR